MKKLYLVATFVIILALAVPAIVSAADPVGPKVFVPLGGVLQREPVIGLTVVSAPAPEVPWMWDAGPGDYVREIPQAIAIDVANDGWSHGYTFYVYDNENPAMKDTTPGTFANHSHNTCPAPPECAYVPGGRTLVNPLKVSSGKPITGLTEVEVSGIPQTLGSTLLDGGPGAVDHYFINQTQTIHSLDRPLGEGYHYQIGLTFGIYAN